VSFSKNQRVEQFMKTRRWFGLVESAHCRSGSVSPGHEAAEYAVASVRSVFSETHADSDRPCTRQTFVQET
jgi:hypothetical protein